MLENVDILHQNSTLIVPLSANIYPTKKNNEKEKKKRDAYNMVCKIIIFKKKKCLKIQYRMQTLFFVFCFFVFFLFVFLFFF